MPEISKSKTESKQLLPCEYSVKTNSFNVINFCLTPSWYKFSWYYFIHKHFILLVLIEMKALLSHFKDLNNTYGHNWEIWECYSQVMLLLLNNICLNEVKNS